MTGLVAAVVLAAAPAAAGPAATSTSPSTPPATAAQAARYPAATCPKDLAKLRPPPGEVATCTGERPDRDVRARAWGLPPPFDGYVSLRAWDPAPRQAGGPARVFFALGLPDGTLQLGRDVSDLLREGKLRPAGEQEAGVLVTASLFAAFDVVHGPVPVGVPGATALAAQLSHLPAPHVTATPDGGYEVLAYGRTDVRSGPGGDRTTIDQVKVRLRPDGSRYLADPSIGRLYDAGDDARGRYEAWRPDARPPAP